MMMEVVYNVPKDTTCLIIDNSVSKLMNNAQNSIFIRRNAENVIKDMLWFHKNVLSIKWSNIRKLKIVSNMMNMPIALSAMTDIIFRNHIKSANKLMFSVKDTISTVEPAQIAILDSL